MIDRWPFSFVSARPGHKGLLGSQAGPEGLQWVNLSGQPVKCSLLSKEELTAKKKTRKKRMFLCVLFHSFSCCLSAIFSSLEMPPPPPLFSDTQVHAYHHGFFFPLLMQGPIRLGGPKRVVNGSGGGEQPGAVAALV